MMLDDKKCRWFSIPIEVGKIPDNARFVPVSRQVCRTIEEYATLMCSFLISLVFYRRKDLASADIRRIAVIKLDHIGDVILSIPALASLRAHFPQARITMIVNSSSKMVAGCIPCIDEVFCYNARFFDKAGGGKMFNFTGGMRFVREMRKRRFDLIVDLRGSFASLAFALLSRGKYRIDRGTYLVRRKTGKIPRAFEHEAEVNLDILARAGIPAESRDMSLELKAEDIDSAHSLLGEYLNSNSPVIVIHPGAPASLKRWSAERYAQLVGKLLQEVNARVILIGGRGEKQFTQPIASATGGQVADLSERTTLGQLAAILKSADLFIGNDSGPMHLAAACGTRVIGLFGPTSPQRFSPYSSGCVALRMERNCPPCMREKCRKPGYRCIDSISVDDVMKIARQML